MLYDLLNDGDVLIDCKSLNVYFSLFHYNKDNTCKCLFWWELALASAWSDIIPHHNRQFYKIEESLMSFFGLNLIIVISGVMKPESKSSVKPKLTPQNSTDTKPPLSLDPGENNLEVRMSLVWSLTSVDQEGDSLTASEMENVTTVFRYFETGLREATILPKVKCCQGSFYCHKSMECLCIISACHNLMQSESLIPPGQ